jgi:hypothetical protein
LNHGARSSVRPPQILRPSGPNPSVGRPKSPNHCTSAWTARSSVRPPQIRPSAPTHKFYQVKIFPTPFSVKPTQPINFSIKSTKFNPQSTTTQPPKSKPKYQSEFHIPNIKAKVSTTRSLSVSLGVSCCSKPKRERGWPLGFDDRKQGISGGFDFFFSLGFHCTSAVGRDFTREKWKNGEARGSASFFILSRRVNFWLVGKNPNLSATTGHKLFP